MPKDVFQPMYKKMYVHLFNALLDAQDELEGRNYGQAASTLREAQLWCEDQYMKWPETDCIRLDEDEDEDEE